MTIVQRTPDRARMIQVIEVECARCNEPPSAYRIVTQYWSLKGELLAERDPYPDLATPSAAPADGQVTP